VFQFEGHYAGTCLLGWGADQYSEQSYTGSARTSLNGRMQHNRKHDPSIRDTPAHRRDYIQTHARNVTGRTVMLDVGFILDDVTEFSVDGNTARRLMALKITQPLIEISPTSLCGV
jgi:hypothetical protein